MIWKVARWIQKFVCFHRMIVCYFCKKNTLAQLLLMGDIEKGESATRETLNIFIEVLLWRGKNIRSNKIWITI
ncbi:hypothetical protein [Bacteroides acidifaciens]|uniref:hypothetical protein n=1 Tax=Bacteroides acidifaciens TaxID=85831 RepID=UPI00248B7676|nr:hypothetical protein [Bacteroides acidifaciens]